MSGPATPDRTTPDDPPAPAAPLSQAAARTGETLLADLRSEIARADSKASVLVAALGMTAGVFSGLLAGGGWSPAVLSGPGTAAWWAGAGALALALFALLLAVLPRYRSRGWTPGEPLTHFGDIQQAARAGQLTAALMATERRAADGLTRALTETSRIAARKHQWIRTGLIAFAVGTVLLPAALLIG
ncbi:Pycsar system effector family protein [Streptomyces sp. NPDC058297]|uniref:Pycsar system effector family protein n=1 Tax=Streptomyces sp. NPDC058297 TaxID=3346433 RepID=UPI0036E9DAE3